MAISLRQELFNSEVAWIDISDIQVEKERCVEFLTVNLKPNQSIIWKYLFKSKPVNKELILEKSVLLIMNEEYEIRKEIIPEQKFVKE